MDYLKDLGIDGVWLSPIYPTPLADFTYDISNYRDIEPLFGDLEIFDAFVARAKELGKFHIKTRRPLKVLKSCFCKRFLLV